MKVHLLGLFYLCISLSVQVVYSINSCQPISSAGTYQITADVPATNQICFDIQASNVILEGNAHSIAGTQLAVKVHGVSNVSIRNFVVRNMVQSISISQCTNCTVEYVAISNIQAGANPAGIIISSCNNISVRYTTIKDSSVNAQLLSFTDTNGIYMFGNSFSGFTFDASSVVAFVNIAQNSSSITIDNTTITDIHLPDIPSVGVAFCGFCLDSVRDLILTNSLVQLVDSAPTSMVQFTGVSINNTFDTTLNITGNSFISNTVTNILVALFSADTNSGLTLNILDNEFRNNTAAQLVFMNLLESTDLVTIVDNTIINNTGNTLLHVGSSNSVIYNNLADNTVIDSAVFSMQCLWSGTTITFDQNFCYPTSLPCCYHCSSNLQVCEGNFTTSSYSKGTCSGLFQPCTLGRSYQLTAYPVDPYATIDDGIASLEIEFLGYDNTFDSLPKLTFFDGNTKLDSSYYSRNPFTGYFFLDIPGVGTDRFFNITYSISGTFDPLQTPFFIPATTYSAIPEGYGSADLVYFTWFGYTGSLPFLYYNFSLTDGSDTLANSTISPGFTFSVRDFPLLSYAQTGAQYTACVVPVFAPGVAGLEGCKEFAYNPGPTAIDFGYGSNSNEAINRIVYDPNNQTYYAIGTTNGIIGPGFSGTGSDLFVLQYFLKNNTFVPLAQPGTDKEDIATDAIFGSDGCIYIVAFQTTSNVMLWRYCPGSAPTMRSPYAAIEGPTHAALGLVEGPGKVLWVLTQDTSATSFSVSTYEMSPSLLTKNELTVSVGQDKTYAAAILVHPSQPMVYVAGYAIGGPLTSGFVAQFEDDVTEPKTFVFRYDYNTGANDAPVSTVTVSAATLITDSNTLVVGSVDEYSYVRLNFIPLSNAGTIPDYLGCGQVSLPPAQTTTDAITFADGCRAHCAFDYSPVIYPYACMTNALTCSCYDEAGFATFVSEPEGSCNSFCANDATQTCGDSTGTFLSCYASSRTGSVIPINTGINGSVTSLSAVPSNADMVAVLGRDSNNIYFYTTVTLESVQTPYERRNGLVLYDSFVDPYSLNLILAGSAVVPFVDTASMYKGQIDGYLEVISSGYFFGGTSVMNDIQITYSDFSSIDIKWDKPTNFPDILTATYTVLMQDPKTGLETPILQNYTGTAYTYSTQPFDKNYRVRAMWNGNSLLSSYFYASRMIVLSPISYINHEPVVRTDGAGSKVYAMFSDPMAYNMTVATLGYQNGNIVNTHYSDFENTNAKEFFPFSGTNWIAGGDAGAQQINGATSTTVEPSSYVTSVFPGSNNTAWTVGLKSEGANYILTIGHYNSTAQINYANYSTIFCAGNGLAFGKEHTARSSLFVFLSCPSLTLLKIPFNEYWEIDISLATTVIDSSYFSELDNCSGIEIDEQADVVYLTMYQQAFSQFRMDTYNIATKALTTGKSVYMTPDTDYLKVARARTAGAGFWHAVLSSGNRVQLYYWDLLGPPAMLHEIPVTGSLLTATSIATLSDGTIALGGYVTSPIIGDTESFFTLFLDDFPSPTTLAYVSHDTFVNFTWAPPAGIQSQFASSLFYNLVRLDAGLTQVYTGPNTYATDSDLLSTSQYAYRLTAYYDTDKYVVYPNITVNTQPKSVTINEVQANSLHPKALAALDSANSLIYVLADDMILVFNAATLAKINDKHFDFSPYINITWSDMKVDKQGNVRLVGHLENLTTKSVLLTITPSLNLLNTTYDISLAHPEFSFYAWSNLVILPNNEIWICGLAGTAEYSSIAVTIIPPTSAPPNYLLWNKNVNEQVVGIAYNPVDNLVYVFGAPRDVDGNFLPYILTVNVSTLEISPFEWTLSFPKYYAYISQVVYDPYLHTLYASTVEADDQKRQLSGQEAYAIEHFTLDSHGAIVSGRETTTTLTVDLIAALPPFSGDLGAGIAGKTYQVLPGNIQISNSDAFDGPENGLLLQFAGSFSNLITVDYFSDERTLNKYYIALEEDSQQNAYVYLRMVPADPIGNISLSVTAITDASATFSWNKPPGIPDLSYVAYSISCYADSVPVFNHTVYSPAPSPNYTCPFPPQHSSYQIGITTIYKSGASYGVTLYPTIAPIQFTNITNSSVVVTVGYIPTNFPYTIQISNTSSFAIILQTLSQGNQTITGLVVGQTYYFRIVMNSIQGIYFYYDTINFTIPAVPCSNIYCACSANQIRCQNGTCVDSLRQCVVHPSVVCPSSSSFLCANQTCVKSHKECAIGSVSCVGTSCWDGSCVASASACSIVPACPVLTTRCPDGTCANTSTQCNISLCPSSDLCPDGSCRPCYNTYGCPATLPLLEIG